MKINEAEQISYKILKKLGFRHEECVLITQNLIAAELAEKKTHGLMRLKEIYQLVKSGNIKPTSEEISVISEHLSSIHIDGKYKPGFYVIYKSLDIAFEKIKKSGVLAIALRNISNSSGYMGDYARLAVEKNLIFISYNTSSPARLIPYGTNKKLWGTNPITIGIPASKVPVILDMSSSISPWGNIMLAKSEGKNIKKGVAVDSKGDITTNPDKAIEGGLLPFSEHKGSGLALIGELLGGALTNSKVGESAVKGGWGTFYILINPSMFRDINEFKHDVQMAINELKSAPKAKTTKRIYFPGERSYLKRQYNLNKNNIKVNKKLKSELMDLLNK